jgi:LuxR family transcriptional regulator, maltose regulon positive regulatory protein
MRAVYHFVVFHRLGIMMQTQGSLEPVSMPYSRPDRAAPEKHMSIILTKIKVPGRRKDVYRRQRLIDALHQNLHRKLTFISAPAGYGKTTLLIDFANDLDVKICWCRIGREDADLIPFAEYFIAAFRQVFPDFGTDALQMLKNTSGALDPRSLGVELINEMVRHVTDYCVFFLDDFHIIGEIQPVVDLLETIIEYLPDQVRLIVASRSVFGIPSLNLYVRNDLATLSADDLRFRPQELKELVQRNYDIELSDQQVADLAMRSDGWIIAMLMAVRTFETGLSPQLNLPTDDLYTFLAEEVVNRLPDHLRKFLAETAIFDEFSLASCNAVLEIDNAGEYIQELEARNLFLLRSEIAGGHYAYRYHQLFNEFLYKRLSESDRAWKDELHTRAARWYADAAAWEQAVEHILAAGDREQAARWMDEVARSYFFTGRTNILARWMEALAAPPDLRHLAPLLVLNWAKVVIERGEFAAGEKLLDLAAAPLEERGDVYQLANLFVTKGMALIFQGRPAEAYIQAEQARSILVYTPRENYYQYQTDRLMGIALCGQNRLEAGIAHLQMAANGFRKLVESGTDELNRQAVHDLAETLKDLSLSYFEVGDVSKAETGFLEVLQIRRKLKSNLGALAISVNNVGYLYYQLGHYTTAWKANEEALAIANSIRHYVGMVHILNSRGDLLRDLDEWETAESAYMEAIKRSESTDQRALFYTYLGLSGLELRRGNYHDALYWLREGARSRGLSYEAPEYQARLGEIYLMMGQYEMAYQTINLTLKAWRHLPKPTQDQTLALFHLGATLFNLNRRAEALDCLEQALGGAAELGYDQFLVVAARHACEYLSYAVRVMGETPQMVNLIRRVESFPTFSIIQEEAPEPVQVTFYQMRIYGFGAGMVKIDQEAIPLSDWRSANARNLFYFMLDNGGARKDEITTDLWPDFNPSQVNSNFHATLWRVRKALGAKDAIIIQNNRYMLNPSIPHWYDVAEFEQLLRTAQQAHDQVERQVILLEKAVNLYQGDFLEGFDNHWANQRRQELQRLYLHALEKLAHWEFEKQRYTQARVYYERIVALDPFQDEIHLAIIRCLAADGLSSAARAHYHFYKENLWKELQLEPEPALQAYYENLPG